jgi:hypothetical protein
MGNVDRVREITERFAENRDDREILRQAFAPDFVHWANGRRSDLEAYAAHLAGYRERYDGFRVPAWDELFEAGDGRVVASYVLEARTKSGSVERIPVMAIWRFNRDGKVASLREVDGPAAA